MSPPAGGTDDAMKNKKLATLLFFQLQKTPMQKHRGNN
jgi:hypothetical protein